MTVLETVIKDVKEARKFKNRPWIYDDNGEIKKEVLVCDVLPILEELKDYECTLFDAEYIFENGEELDCGNTYNFGANISNDLNWHTYKIDDNYYGVVMVHLFGDIRGGYTDYFVIDMESKDFLECLYNACDNSIYQFKKINDRYTADMLAISEVYNVFDTYTQEEVGDFYEMEVSDLLEKLEKEEE